MKRGLKLFKLRRTPKIEFSEERPLIVGITHGSILFPLEKSDIKKVINLIKKHVTPGMKVGLEITPTGLEALSSLGVFHNDFLREVFLAIKKRGGEAIPLESNSRSLRYKETFYQAHRIVEYRITNWEKKLEQLMQTNDVLSALRSGHMLKRMIAEKTVINIVGADHAGHIKDYAPHIPTKIKYLTKPDYDDNISPTVRKQLIKYFKAIEPRQN